LVEENLVQLICREVLKQLSARQEDQAKRVIVLLSGGTLGFSTAIDALKYSKQDHSFKFVLACTSGACNVHDIDSIKDELGAEELFKEDDRKNPLTLLHNVKGLLVPALTRNTAAKTAGQDFALLGSGLILEALMYGVPVVAVRDSADPDNSEWSSLGVYSPAPGLRKVLQQNLEKLEQMGVILTSSEQFRSVIEETLIPKFQRSFDQNKADYHPGTEVAQNRLVSADDVRKAKDANITTMILPARGTMITPLAKDVAEELGICFKLQLK